MNKVSPFPPSPWLIGFVLLFLMGAQPVVAEDMWEGVFTYQKKMADYGNPEAQVKLGEMYEEGHGTGQDYEMARKWYQQALDQGYMPAKKKLAQLEARKKREIAEKKRAEQERIAQEQAEKERQAREKAAAEERARKQQAEKARLEQEAQKKRMAATSEADKKRKEEEERQARERAKEAMKKMMSTPSAYTED